MCPSRTGCLSPLTGHLDLQVAMSTMQDKRFSGPVLPPGRVRRSFPEQFKADAVALVLDEGRSIASVARALGIGESNLGNWVRRARVDRGEREGLTTTELARLRREVTQLRMERDLLKQTDYAKHRAHHPPRSQGGVPRRDGLMSSCDADQESGASTTSRVRRQTGLEDRRPPWLSANGSLSRPLHRGRHALSPSWKQACGDHACLPRPCRCRCVPAWTG